MLSRSDCTRYGMFKRTSSPLLPFRMMDRLLHGALPSAVVTAVMSNSSLKNVQNIHATDCAFAAILEDETVVARGLSTHGGDNFGAVRR